MRPSSGGSGPIARPSRSRTPRFPKAKTPSRSSTRTGIRMRRTDRSAAPTPLDGVDVVLADLDGVVYRGADAIPYAVDSLNRAQQDHRVGYLTNNASRTDAS